MTPDDRDLLADLRRRQEELRLALREIDTRLTGLERAAAGAILPPPLPEAHPLPPIPPLVAPPVAMAKTASALPPLPMMAPAPAPALPAIPPPAPPPPRVPPEAMEIRISRWLTRIGAVLLVLMFAFLDAWLHLGAWGNLAAIGAIGMAVILFGQRQERRGPEMRLYGRTVMAAGLAGLYFMVYAASSIDALQVVHSPRLGLILLLAWSVYVLRLAAERKSQALGFAAILLAYISTAIHPLSSFTLGADLLLAATAVFLLLRQGWSAVSYLALAGTYLALLRRLVIDDSGTLTLDSRVIRLAPHLGYLGGAWLLFTAAALLAHAPTFRTGKRLGLVCLNNGIAAVLLAVTLQVAGYDAEGIGRGLMIGGLALLGAWFAARRVMPAEPTIAGAYLAQAAALLLGGAMIVFTGGERAVIFLLAALFLGAAGTFSGSVVLRICSHVAAFFATLFVTWEIAYWGHSPWIYGLGGAAVMLVNAHWARRGAAAGAWVEVSAFYSVLATALVAVMLAVGLTGEEIAPGLAIATVVLSLAAARWLPELPAIAQTLLIAAQVMVLFPGETGEIEAGWPFILISGATVLMILWWSLIRRGPRPIWVPAIEFIYALALVGLAYRGLRPHFGEQGWLVATSLLAASFLAFGALTRVWAVALCGQAFLVLALAHFFAPATPHWHWVGLAVPVAVVLATGRGIRSWLRAFPEIRGGPRSFWRGVAFALQGLALLMTLAWIKGGLAPGGQVVALLMIGTLLLALSVRRSSWLGVRMSFVPTAWGMVVYATEVSDHPATRLLALSMLALLSQPGLLRNGIRTLVSTAEQWILLVTAVGTGWLFVSRWVESGAHHLELTLAWGLYAVFLFFFGLALWERRLRWAGLVVLLCAVLRVVFVDLWGAHSSGYKVMTLAILAVITLGLGYLYSRHAERLKAWL